MRFTIRTCVLLLGVCSTLATAVPCAAQGFGIGGRMTFVKSDTVVEREDDDDSVRFFGGHVRMRPSPRLGIEVSLDRRSETFTLLNEKVVDYPIQTSLLLYPVSGAFSPYILGGPGWYTHKVEALDSSVESVSTTKFGWHAGFGAELLMGRHAGIHADYRYTFLSFGDDDDDDDFSGATPRNSFVNSLLPSHEGSMWTFGVTVYF